MVATSIRYPDAVSQQADTWVNQNNVKAKDVTYATIASNAGGYLQGNDFYFYNDSIPVSATIKGIKVIASGYQSSNIDTLGAELSKDNFSTYTTERSPASVPNSYSDIIIGGTSDLWGTTWTQAEIISGNFCMRFRSYGSGPGGIFYLDSIGIEVTYDLPTASSGGFFAHFNKAKDWVKKGNLWLPGFNPGLIGAT